MLEHILRRMGFGASPELLAYWADLPISTVITQLLNYENQPTDIDTKINNPDYVNITTSNGAFSPDTVINDARQRWLFRMLHSPRGLEEKMALFWHNHFATTYSKVAGNTSSQHGTKMMDGDPRTTTGAARGQIHLFRQYATGNFRDLLIEVAKHPAMVIFLDGRTNTRTKPQENFGREIMELFTMGLGNYTEQDVYAAARVFTGFNIELVGDRADTTNSYYRYVYRPNDHDATAKEFTFAIYPDGNRTIPARAASAGEQDAIDFIGALARHPATANRLATRLYKFFINDTAEADVATVSAIAGVFLASGGNMKTTLQAVFSSKAFLNPSNIFQHYSWPIEYVVRAIKEVGWKGFSVNNAMTPLLNMGQQLYEPPDVNGWELGPGWFSTSSMLARMNFASTLAGNQKFNLARDAQPYRTSPDRVLEYALGRYKTIGLSGTATTALSDYLRSGAAWTGSDAQLQIKMPGLSRLVVGAGEYQFS
ncbi:MAG: DUF1800 domain-containing protein [Vicinamibacterales bacterium]